MEEEYMPVAGCAKAVFTVQPEKKHEKKVIR